jgi:uncharacterized membrane protein
MNGMVQLPERLARLKAALLANLRRYAGLHVMVITYIVVVSFVSLARHYTFLSSAWDLGIFNQAFHSTISEGRFFYYTVELYANPGGNLFGVHFSPILVFLLPFYALVPGPETLLMVQTVALALGAYPFFFLAREVIKEKSVALMFSMLYLVYPHVFSVNTFDFHPDAFFIPFALFSLHFFYRQSWGKYFLFLTLAFLTKEFASLPFLAFGLIEAWSKRKRIVDSLRKRAFGDKQALIPLATMVFAALWFFFANAATIFFGGAESSGFVEGSPWIVLGGNPLDPSTMWSLARLDYLGALEYDFASKLLYFITLIGPFAFLPMLALASFLPTLVWLIPSFLSNYPPYYTIGYHYSAFITPFIAVAAVYGYRNFLASTNITGKRVSGIMKKLLFCSLLLILGISLTLQSLSVGLSLSLVSSHDNAVYEVLGFIPPTSSVLTQFDIFPHLSDRTNSYVVPLRFDAFKEATYRQYVEALFEKRIEYVLVDINPDLRLDAHRKVSMVVLAQIEKAADYGPYAFVDGVLLYKLNYTGPLERYKPLVLVYEPKPHIRVEYTGTVLFEQSFPRGMYNLTLDVRIDGEVNGTLFTLKVKQGEDTVASREIYGEYFGSSNYQSLTLPFSVTSQLKELQFVITDNTGLTDIYVQQIKVTQTSYAGG